MTVQDEDQLDEEPTSFAFQPETMPEGWYLIHDNWKLDTDQFGN